MEEEKDLNIFLGKARKESVFIFMILEGLTFIFKKKEEKQ